ncbi:MAG TPA: endonuclease/exonuclease/phosphatase family protein [Dongiaceae bacterium]|nr:endonuclease/exonuclease/phosphatase family protein [Dongiaceae bacterium]
MNMISPPIKNLQLTVLTVNLHKGFSAGNRRFMLPELREMLRQVHADIVFLQEVVGEHSLHSARQQMWPSVPQYEYLADSTWSEFAYGRNAVYPEGHHGNALLSKFPIVENRNVDVSLSRTEKRGLLYCRLLVPGSETNIHTICVHLGLRERHRSRQLALMCELIQSLPPDAPLIVAGDFNDWRLKANRYLEQNAGLHEVFTKVLGGPVATFPARWPFLRLDRIYVRNTVLHQPTVLGTRPWSHLSDHLPLAAELMLEPMPISMSMTGMLL